MRHAGRQQASQPRWSSSSEGPPRGARQTRPREVAKRSPILSSWNALTRSGRSPTTIFSTACRISSVSAVATRPTSSLTLARSTGAGSTPAKLRPRCSRTAPSVLHLSEAEAYLRIAAARAARQHPVLLALLADGRLHLTAIAKLAPHLTPENREALLERAAHRSKREIEELVAELAPRPDAPAVMRKLPDRRAGTTSPAPRLGPDAEVPSLGLRPERRGFGRSSNSRPDGVAAGERRTASDGSRRQGSKRVRPTQRCRPLPAAGPRVEPLAPARYKVQFTASAELRDKLERLRALMRSSVPDGDLAAIVEQAVTEKLQRLEARRFARTQAPRKTLSQSRTSPATRQIPAAVKRAVYERDGGRCRYEDEQGRRCTARQGLEFHHRRPFGHGGDHSVENVSLACKCHNGYLAEVDYGREAMARHRRSRPAPWSRRRLRRRDDRRSRERRVHGR